MVVLILCLRKLADRYSLKIIEDAAESLGSKFDGIMQEILQIFLHFLL